MSAYLKLLAGGGFNLIIAAVIVLGMIGFLIWINKRKQSTVKGNSKNLSLTEDMPDKALAEISTLFGEGKYRALMYRRHPIWGPCVDFTRIKEPIGEIDLAETSLPVSGAVYVVREVAGSVVPYNEPRQMDIVETETPEFAWRCTHWEDARAFWTVPQKWFSNINNWYVIGMMLIVFIAVLITLGGGK